MSWLEKILPKSKSASGKRRNIPEGVWTKCASCEQTLYRAEVERNHNVCPKCDHHMRIGARQRLEAFLDKDGREELAAEEKQQRTDAEHQRNLEPPALPDARQHPEVGHGATAAARADWRAGNLHSRQIGAWADG